MNRIFADTDVGMKNIAFGMALFLLIGVAIGIPLNCGSLRRFDTDWR